MANACNIERSGIRRRFWAGVALVSIGGAASFLHTSFLGQVVAFFGFLSLFQALDGT